MTQRGGFIGGSTNDVLNTVMKVLGIIVVIFIIYYLFFSSDATSHVTMLDAREMVRIPANQLPMQTTIFFAFFITCDKTIRGRSYWNTR